MPEGGRAGDGGIGAVFDPFDPKQPPLNFEAMSVLASQFEDGSSRWGSLHSAMVVSNDPDGSIPQSGFDGATLTYRIPRGTGRWIATGVGSGFGAHHNLCDRPPSEAALRVRVLWYYFALSEVESVPAMQRYESLAERAWATLPRTTRDRYAEPPWIDPRAAIGEVHSWTTLLHVIAWRSAGLAGLAAPRSVFFGPNRSREIELFFQEAKLRNPCVINWSEAVLSSKTEAVCDEVAVSWPPKCFESLLTPDLFLASKLAIDQLLADEQAIGGAAMPNRLDSAVGGPPPEEIPQYVTLDQMAAVVSRTKRTLEAYRDSLPPPDVRGGGGRPHEWLWTKVRPTLEEKFDRKLPERYPSARS